jgi:O-antigen ligase
MPPTSVRLPYLILLVLSLTVPYAVVEHTYPIPTFYSELSAYTLYVLMAVALAGVAYCQRHTHGSELLRVPKVAWVPFALALWLLLQLALTQPPQPMMNLLGAGFLLAALMVTLTGFWVRQLGLTDITLKCGAYALLAGGLAAVCCQLVQLTGQEAHFSPLVLAYSGKLDRRLYGNMAQANHLATYLSFAMVAALYLVQIRRLPLAAWLALSAAYALGEALTVSRTPLLQTAMIVVFGWLMARTLRREPLHATKSLRLWLIPLGLAVLYVAMYVLVRWANVKFHLELGDSAASRFEDAGQISPRLSLWRYGIAMFKSHPLTGVGWGGFPYYQYEFATQLGKVEVANNSHNIVIDLLAKTGLIGAAIFAFGLLGWLWRALRAPLTAERVLCFAIIALVAVHAMVEYPQQYMFFLLPVAFILGLLETGMAQRLPAAAGQGVYAALIVAGLLAIVPVVRDYRRSEVLYYGTAPETEYRAAPATIFGAWGQYGLATLLAMDGSNLPYKLAMHEQALTLLPGDTVLKRYAVLLALAGRDQAAFDVVRRLHVFAEGGKTWPANLRSLMQMCDQQGGALNRFKSMLSAAYGTPAAVSSRADDSEEGDSE